MNGHTMKLYEIFEQKLKKRIRLRDKQWSTLIQDFNSYWILTVK